MTLLLLNSLPLVTTDQNSSPDNVDQSGNRNHWLVGGQGTRLPFEVGEPFL